MLCELVLKNLIEIICYTNINHECPIFEVTLMQSRFIVSANSLFIMIKTCLLVSMVLLVACAPAITKKSGVEADPSAFSYSGNDANRSADPQVLKGYADIPIPANDVLIVSESLLLNSGEQWLGRAVLESKLDANSAFEYFSKNMRTQGWVTITVVQSKISLLTFEKGMRIATVEISQRLNNTSSVRVTVAPRESIPANN